MKEERYLRAYNLRDSILPMNYNKTRNKYIDFRKNMAIAERDNMEGGIMQITPIIPLRFKPTKITPNKAPDIKMTKKRAQIFFTRDYLKEYSKITSNGLARKHEGIFKNTRVKPDKQLVKDFSIILHDLVDKGILERYGTSRGVPAYIKIINPDKIEGLRD